MDKSLSSNDPMHEAIKRRKGAMEIKISVGHPDQAGKEDEARSQSDLAPEVKDSEREILSEHEAHESPAHEKMEALASPELHGHEQGLMDEKKEELAVKDFQGKKPLPAHDEFPEEGSAELDKVMMPSELHGKPVKSLHERAQAEYAMKKKGKV